MQPVSLGHNAYLLVSKINDTLWPIGSGLCERRASKAIPWVIFNSRVIITRNVSRISADTNVLRITLIHPPAAAKRSAGLFLARDKSVWTTPGAYTEETPRDRPQTHSRWTVKGYTRPESTLMRAQSWVNNCRSTIMKLHMTRAICSRVLPWTFSPSTQRSTQKSTPEATRCKQCRYGSGEPIPPPPSLPFSCPTLFQKRNFLDRSQVYTTILGNAPMRREKERESEIRTLCWW